MSWATDTKEIARFEDQELMDLTLNFSKDGNAKAFLRDGWSAPESSGTWSLGAESWLEIPLKLDEPHCLTLDVVGCVLPDRSDPQPLEVVFNTRSVASLGIRAREKFRIELAAGQLDRPVGEFRFLHPDFRIPRDHGLPDDRPLAIHFRSLRLQPLAAVRRRDAELRARPQVLVLGQSHIAALEEAVLHREDGDPPRLGFHFFNMTGRDNWVSWSNGFRYAANVVGEIKDLLAAVPYAAMVSMMGGNAHFVHGALNHARKFDFVVPDRPDLTLAADAELVSYDMICARARHDVESALGLLQGVCEELGVPKFHICAPPPAASSEAVVSNLMQSANSELGRRMQSEVKKFGAAAPEFRLKLWLAYRTATQQVCQNFGITFIDVPAASVDARGFIFDHLTSDSFHGTSAFGGMVLSELENCPDFLIAKSITHGQASLP